VLMGLLVGFGCGVGLLGPKTMVVRGELAAAPLAPHMSLSRFQLSEAQWQALNARSRLYFWRPEEFDWAYALTSRLAADDNGHLG
jgi:hypothetical protein